MAYSQTSAASLWASCLRQATAARRSNRWELDRWTWIAQNNGYYDWDEMVQRFFKFWSIRSLTQRQGTRLDRLTWRGANMCSCCRHEMAAACTRESEWSCIMAQPTRQDERMVEMVAPFPASQKSVKRRGWLTVDSFSGWQKMLLQLLKFFFSIFSLFY